MARIQDQELELDDQKNFMEGRMHLDLGSLFVACELELNWWNCGDCGCPSQVILEDLQWS
jgi:hypothetical protein